MQKPEKDNQLPGRALLFFMMLTALALFSIAEAQPNTTARITLVFKADYAAGAQKHPKEYLNRLKTLTQHEEMLQVMSFPQSWVITVRLRTGESLQQLIHQLESATYIRSAEPDYSMSR